MEWGGGGGGEGGGRGGGREGERVRKGRVDSRTLHDHFRDSPILSHQMTCNGIHGLAYLRVLQFVG